MVSQNDQLLQLIELFLKHCQYFYTFGTVKRFSDQQTDSVLTFGKCVSVVGLAIIRSVLYKKCRKPEQNLIAFHL